MAFLNVNNWNISTEFSDFNVLGTFLSKVYYTVKLLSIFIKHLSTEKEIYFVKKNHWTLHIDLKKEMISKTKLVKLTFEWLI